MQGRFDFPQRLAIPISQSRSGVVNALGKFEEECIWIFRQANGLVWQNELTQLRLVQGRCGANFCLRKASRFRIRIGVINRLGHSCVPGPETKAAHFLRVCFPGDGVRQMRNSSRMRWRWPSGEPRYREIETSPEEMHRTAFAAKIRPEFLENAIALRQNAPEPVGVCAVVGTMLLVLVERNWVLNFIWRRVDFDRQFEVAQRLHQGEIKVCHCLRLEFDGSPRSVAFVNEQAMIDKVELDFKCAGMMRDRRGRQP